MTFPSYEDIEEPLLCYLLLHGGETYEVKACDTYRPLANFFDLSASERSNVLSDGSGRSRWNNMVQWARRKLNDYGYLSPTSRGVWKLSEVGVAKAQKIQHNYLLLK